MPGILEGRQSVRVRSRRRSVPRCGSLLAEGLVRTLGVVLPLERVEVPLLDPTAVANRLDRFAFEGAMHPLVSAVLLRTTGTDPLMENAQAHPPDVEIGEPVDRGRRERDTVVGAD